MNITVRIDDGMLGLRALEYHTDRCMELLADAVEDAIRQEFPDADINVIDGGDGVMVFDENKGAIQIKKKVERIVNRVYHGRAWMRYTARGIGQRLKAGLWLNRPYGQRVGIRHLVDGEYAMFFCDGDTPPFKVVYFKTENEMMEFVTALTDTSEWRLAGKDA